MPDVEAEPRLAEARPLFPLSVDAYPQMIRAGIFVILLQASMELIWDCHQPFR